MNRNKEVRWPAWPPEKNNSQNCLLGSNVTLKAPWKLEIFLASNDSLGASLASLASGAAGRACRLEPDMYSMFALAGQSTVTLSIPFSCCSKPVLCKFHGGSFQEVAIFQVGALFLWRFPLSAFPSEIGVMNTDGDRWCSFWALRVRDQRGPSDPEHTQLIRIGCGTCELLLDGTGIGACRIND